MLINVQTWTYDGFSFALSLILLFIHIVCLGLGIEHVLIKKMLESRKCRGMTRDVKVVVCNLWIVEFCGTNRRF